MGVVKTKTKKHKGKDYDNIAAVFFLSKKNYLI